MNWPEIERIYVEASALPPADRAAYLNRTCAGDGELRREVEGLLAAEAHNGSFLQRPPSRLTASLLEQTARPAGVIGSYRVISVLGEGGMGTVYQAEQQTPRRTVALKVIKVGMAGDQILRRFQQEAEALGRLQHPGIAQIYDAGTAQQGSGPQPYFAMELIEGQPLLQYAEQSKLDVRAKLELMAKVCDGVHHAHQRGILHRDLKPGNILVDQTGQPKILDFGVARVMDSDIQTTRQTDLGQLIGTLAYMSPEQASGNPHDLDTRSDVYALGVILYELLAGQLPYQTKGLALHEAVQTIQQQDPTALSSIDARYRGDIEIIVEKALEKDKDRRYTSAAELASDIRRHLADEPIAARPVSAIYQLKKFTRRNRALVLGTAAVLVALIGGVIVSTYQAVRAREAERRANTAAATTQAVNDFLQNDLLAQASSDRQQASGARPDLNLTVRTALDRAASRISGKFDKQPEVEAAIRATIATTYGELDLGEEALQQIRRSLELHRRVFGLEDPKTLQIQQKTAELLLYTGAYKEAESLYKQTIESQRRVLGPENRDLLKTEAGLVIEYLAVGRDKEAAALGEKVLASRRRTLSPDDPAIVKGLHNLAIAYKHLGDFAKSETLMRQVLETQRRLQGPETSDVATTLANLANLLSSQGKMEEAMTANRQALAIIQKTLGPDHKITLTIKYNLATCIDLLGHPAEAEVLLRDLLDRRTKLYGPESTEALKTTTGLAHSLFDQAKYAASEEIYGKNWQLMRHSFGPDHPRTLEMALGLVKADLKQRKFLACEPVAREVMQTDQKVRPEAWEGYLAESLLGASLLGQKRFAEAEPRLLAGFRGLQARKDGIELYERDQLGTARERIIQLYSEWGKPQEAKAWEAAH